MDTDALYAGYIDADYAAFSAKLSKNHDFPYIGIRIPILRKIGKELDDFPYAFKYHEDVLLKGFWIASRKLPFCKKKALLLDHLEALQTWDEVDTLASSIKPRKSDLEDVYEFFFSLLKDTRTMPRRLGIVTLMSLRKSYPERREELMKAISASDNRDYYVSMAVAWALSFFYIDGKDAEHWIYLTSPETQKRTWQKIRDSRRT